MKKIDRNTLIAYLYGELNESEARKIEQYLEESPVARADWEQLSATRVQLQLLEDESVPDPFILNNKYTHRTSDWKRWAVAAAVVVAVLYSAAWLNIRITYRNQELAIRFGEGEAVKNQIKEPSALKQVSVVPKNTATETAPSKGTQGYSTDSLTLKRIAVLEQKLQRQIYELQLKQKALQARQTGLTSEQVTDLISDLQQENFETMQQLMSAAGQQQQLYSQQLMAQLTEYLASQRKEDLQKINMVLNTIVQNTDQKQQQTDLVLTQVISKLNEGSKNTKGKN